MAIARKPRLPNTPINFAIRVAAAAGGAWMAGQFIEGANGNLLAAGLAGGGVGWLLGEMVLEAKEMLRRPAPAPLPRLPASQWHALPDPRRGSRK